MKTVVLPDGQQWPMLGLGTWRMGESNASHVTEVRALREAFSLGYRLIDTAEMYGDGGAERVVGEAVAAAILARDITRNETLIVSKVWPHHATRRGTIEACENSLGRLRLDYLDLYLLHWPSEFPIEETVEAFETLRGQGKILRWGVSNFDIEQMQSMVQIGAARHRKPGCAINQVYYSLNERGIEFNLLPWQRAQRIPTMAYRPIDKGEVGENVVLTSIGKRLGATPVQVALAWLFHQKDVIAIPKAVQRSHLEENWKAQFIQFSQDDLEAIDRSFPPPHLKTPLTIR